MSNPSVITFDSINSFKGKIKRFAIEDNIGEAIHLHVNKIRFDFTINEFLKFADIVKDSLTALNLLCGYKLENFDAYFLKEICKKNILDLIDIKIEEIQLSKLNCIVRYNYFNDLNFLKPSSLWKTPAYNYLRGEKNAFLKYNQYNYFNVKNSERLTSILKSIQENGYPYNNQYIILFQGQNIIRDGQHRAAVLAYLYGLKHHVKVMRFYFKGRRHTIHLPGKNLIAIFKYLIKNIQKIYHHYQ